MDNSNRQSSYYDPASRLQSSKFVENRMDGSKYYSNNAYLSGIFHKQQRMNRPVIVEEKDTPFHFKQKQMTDEEQKKLMQKKIFDNPSLYASTHVKCQICNRYIEIELADHHSKLHFDEEERIENILRQGRFDNEDN